MSPALFSALYDAFREISGVALVTGGLSFLVSPGRDYAQRRLGALLLGSGFLFCLSAFDPQGRIPVDVSNLLVIAALLFNAQATIDLVIYLFSEEAPAAAPWMFRAGIIWSLCVWILPFADYLFGLGPSRVNVEDGILLGPFHAFASYAIYLWPLAAVLLVFPLCGIELRALDIRRPGAKFFGIGSIIFGAVVVCIIAGGMLGSRLVYRLGHSLLEALMIAWYFAALVKPMLFIRAREVIREERERIILHDPREAAIIQERVERAIGDPSIIGRADLDLRRLAGIVKVPPYRLSRWLNAARSTTFPAWLNARRVEYAQKLLRDFPDRTIIEISVEAGYSSKSVFNAQFRRITGKNPSEWRRSAAQSGN